MFLLHIALESPVAIQGIWSPANLPFLDLNNTSLVVLKLYAALVFASCIAALLCFSLPGESAAQLDRSMMTDFQQNFFPENVLSPLLSRSTTVSLRPFYFKLLGSFRILSVATLRRAYITDISNMNYLQISFSVHIGIR